MDSMLRFFVEFVFFGGGAAGVAFLLFKYLGKNWIESKFSERLASFKHQQDIEIQRLRIKIDSTLSGVLKIQEKEFETLSEAWSKLDEAYNHVKALVSPGQYVPNIDGMTPDRLKEFLDEIKIRETEKDVIRQSDEKINTYQKIMFWHRLHEVKLACGGLDKYVVRYGIFFPPNLKEKFNNVVSELNSVVLDRAIGQEEEDYKTQFKAWTNLNDKIDPLIQEIEEEIYVRLQSHGSIQ